MSQPPKKTDTEAIYKLTNGYIQDGLFTAYDLSAREEDQREEPKVKLLSGQRRKFFEYLWNHADKALSYETLLQEVWNESVALDNLSTEEQKIYIEKDCVKVTQAIRRLRQDIEGEPPHVVNKNEYWARPDVHIQRFERPGLWPWIRFNRHEVESALNYAKYAREPCTNLSGTFDKAFFGRAEELKDIAGRFSRSRLVTIIGPPGVGKTRLAQEFGRAYQALFPGGVWLCDLTDCTDQAGVLERIAGCWQIPDCDGQLAEQLGRVFAARRKMLLILDNCDEVLKPLEEELLLKWRDQAEHLHILVTSRERLDARESHLCILHPLDDLSAKALFVEVAERVGRRVDDADMKNIAQIVEKLSCLPLAIWLVAPYSKEHTCGEILEEVTDHLERFRNDKEQNLYHRSLDTAIDFSWERLTDAQRTAFLGCAVFRDGFTLEAVEPVGEVWTLLNKSLVYHQKYEPLDTYRWFMYEYLKEYAKRRGRKDPTLSWKVLEQRHAEWYLQHGEEWVKGMFQADGARCLKQLVAERANLRAAWEYYKRTDKEHAVRLAICLQWVARMQHELGSWLALTEELWGLAQQVSLKWQVQAGIARAYALHADERIPEAVGLMEELLERCMPEALDTASNRARLQICLAYFEMERGGLERAEALINDALPMLYAQKDRLYKGLARRYRGTLSRIRGHYADAQKELEAAISLFESLGDRYRAGLTHEPLAIVYSAQRDLERAEAANQQVIKVMEEYGTPYHLIIARNGRGVQRRRFGDAKAALADYQAALEQAKQIGTWRWEATILQNISYWYLWVGEMEKSEEYLDQVVEIRTRHGREGLDRFGLLYKGELELSKRELIRAERHLRQGIEAHRIVGARSYEAYGQLALGVLHLHRDDFEAARECFEYARTLHSEMGFADGEPYTLALLAIVSPPGRSDDLLKLATHTWKRPQEELLVMAAAALALTVNARSERNGNQPGDNNNERIKERLEEYRELQARKVHSVLGRILYRLAEEKRSQLAE